MKLGTCNDISVRLNSLRTSVEVEVEGKLQPTVSRPVYLGVGLQTATHDKICFYLDSFGFFNLGRPLWREDVSLIYSYNCFWALAEQTLSGSNPAELKTIFYCLVWASKSPYLYPRNRGYTELYPRELGSLFVASYNSQGSGGVILTRLPSHRITYFFLRTSEILPSIYVPLHVFIYRRSRALGNRSEKLVHARQQTNYWMGLHIIGLYHVKGK
jgi:hypothetical protein